MLMNRALLRSLIFVIGASLSTQIYAGWFDMDDTIRITDSKPNPNAATVKYAATIHMAGYTDARNNMAPKKIGISTQRISGITGKELLLDRDVAELVANAVTKRFDEAGFQLLESGALYELSGVVKELTYNVKNQDEVSISLETTVKEVATGKVVWSGIIQEKPKGRFAGISGNNKADIANYLQRELGIATQKMLTAISDSLMASHPELFNLTPGTKAIAGVTVIQSGGFTPSFNANKGVATNGTLALSSKPSRAKVYVDGVYFGMSPLRAEIETGIHEISVKLDGHKTTTEKVSVRKGDTTELELVLTR